MDVDRLTQLAQQYPEVQELLKQNHSLSVSLMAARMDAWQQKMEVRLEAFDANHTRAQARLVEQMKELETKLGSHVEAFRRVKSEFRKLEARIPKVDSNGKSSP